MSDPELKSRAALLLANHKLSGPSIEILTSVVEDGFVDESWPDDDAKEESREQRRTIRDLCQMYGV